MYDAADRRFVTVDLHPSNLAVALSINAYLYVIDNPISYIDLFGLALEKVDKVCYIFASFGVIRTVYESSAKAYYVDYKEAIGAYGIDPGAVVARFVYNPIADAIDLQLTVAHQSGEGSVTRRFTQYKVDGLTLISLKYFNYLMCDTGWGRSDREPVVGLPDVIDAYSVLDGYLAGRRSTTEAEAALKKLSELSSKLLRQYQYGNRDYQRYDHLFIGWSVYMNDRFSFRIDPDYTKAMSIFESQLGYNDSSSPNANIKADIMQAIDPRNSNIYEYVTFDPKDGRVVLVRNSTTNSSSYCTAKELNPGLSATKGRYPELMPIVHSLFKKEGDYYKYQYDQASVTLSVAIGSHKFGLELDRGNSIRTALINYNGVEREEVNGKMGKHNYAEGVIRLVEGRLDAGNCHSISSRDW